MCSKHIHYPFPETEHDLKLSITSNYPGKGEGDFHRKKEGFGIRKPEFQSWFLYSPAYMV